LYVNYLDFNPANIKVLLKVAEIYKQQDIKDGAKFVYQQILTLDPENQIAKRFVNGN
ncbi:MAG: hypothetical protein HQL46_16425, partial [Gammaproteobacteria bacterium]|nr:hypothetical protein [Gammaproteobacteria bacterium]